MKFNYIVVEGSIGSGKTALSKKLAEYFGIRACLIAENAATNPFLTPFYLNTAQHGLAMQLHFLVDRLALLKLIREKEDQYDTIISDFLLEKDQIFAPVVLENDELTLYWNVRHRLMPEVICPDLVIYLQCSDETAQVRMEQTQEAHKALMPQGYLQQVHQEYRRFFHLYNDAPILIANTEELDFVGNDEHFDLLLHTMNTMRGKRCYLNLSE